MQIGSISRLSIKCAVCSKKNDCDHKEMENCAYFIPETSIMAETTANISQPLMQPLLREPVREETQRQINKALYGKLYSGLTFGA